MGSLIAIDGRGFEPAQGCRVCRTMTLESDHSRTSHQRHSPIPVIATKSVFGLRDDEHAGSSAVIGTSHPSARRNLPHRLRGQGPWLLGSQRAAKRGSEAYVSTAIISREMQLEQRFGFVPIELNVDFQNTHSGLEDIAQSRGTRGPDAPTNHPRGAQTVHLRFNRYFGRGRDPLTETERLPINVPSFKVCRSVRINDQATGAGAQCDRLAIKT